MRSEIAELEKAERKTLAELEKAGRTTVAELEKAHATTIAGLKQTLRAQPENAEELEDELERTRTELAEELERTRDELAEQLAGMRAELAAIGPAVVAARCTLGMKMSDFALEGDEGHVEAVEYLKPLLDELRTAHTRALDAAAREADEADEKLATLHAEHHDTADEALPVVEQRYQPLIDAEVIAVTIEQARVRVARHRLALVEPGDDQAEIDAHLARELELEAALDELDAARAKVSGLQERKRAAVYHYSHPTLERSRRLREQLAKRLGLHH